jgi:hypothetical protein
MGIGAMGVPLYSNFGVVIRSNEGNGFSGATLPNNPAEANGSSSMGGGAGAGVVVAADEF